VKKEGEGREKVLKNKFEGKQKESKVQIFIFRNQLFSFSFHFLSYQTGKSIIVRDFSYLFIFSNLNPFQTQCKNSPNL